MVSPSKGKDNTQFETSSKMSSVCCVTGAAGYIGSWLVKKLLDRGCVVHATVRNLGDEKVELLRAFHGAAERLRLFEADLYDAAAFDQAIADCEFVFLVAAPMVRHCSDGQSKIKGEQHSATWRTVSLKIALKTAIRPSNICKNATDAVVNATRTILEQCERSKTVRRVIYTGSVVAASPLKEDGSGYKNFVDESCWTPLHLSYGYSNEALNGYVSAKTLCEKELLAYNGSDSQSKRPFEVVTLLPRRRGHAAALPPRQLAGHGVSPHRSRGSPQLPQVHAGSPRRRAAGARRRRMRGASLLQRPSIAGRFLCAAAWPNMRDIVEHHARKHLMDRLNLAAIEVAGEGVRVQAATSKLVDLGFKYRYGTEEVLDCTVESARRLGVL